VPKIPIGNFGNAIADVAPRVNVPAGAFDTTSGLQKLGEIGVRAASGMLEARAISEATTQIQTGKLDLDGFVHDLEQNPYDEEGKPRFEGAVMQSPHISVCPGGNNVH
jgi:hypothetical protein